MKLFFFGVSNAKHGGGVEYDEMVWQKFTQHTDIKHRNELFSNECSMFIVIS
jgi:hypothetical protein